MKYHCFKKKYWCNSKKKNEINKLVPEEKKDVNNKYESLLEENKAMLEKGLISEEEYNSRRAQILGE